MTGAADGLDPWLGLREAASRAALLGCVSAEGFRHERPEFGLVVVAAPGSVLASRYRARWDPLPDYAYHWVRDAAMVMRLAPLLAAREPSAWGARMRDHVAFSLRIATRPGPRRNPWRAGTQAPFRRFLRPDAELAALRGARLLAEPRANIDGTIDAERWSRPQHDGPALRALSCLAAGAQAGAAGAALLALDLGHTRAHAASSCIGPWEEEGELGLHAFTLLAQRAALRAGRAAGLLTGAEADPALGCIETALGGLADPATGVVRGSDLAPMGGSDAAVILGVLLDDAGAGSFGAWDPRILATASWLMDWSADAYPVNRGGAGLIGRSPADRFFGGNPWVPVTLGMAEFHFVLARQLTGPRSLPQGPRTAAFLQACLGSDAAALAGDRRRAAQALVAAGDRHLLALRRHLPATGPLPEQIDPATGRPASCPDLTWSHAALVAACEARRRARCLIA